MLIFTAKRLSNASLTTRRFLSFLRTLGYGFVWLGSVWAQAAATPDWITDPASGCSTWNPYPKPEETILWIGACVDGKATGPGTLTWFRSGKPTSMHSGTFVAGKLNGKGKLVWENGAAFEGEFVDFERTGQGSLRWANGNRYEGTFAKGIQQGAGKFFWAFGTRLEGQFQDGRLVGAGQYFTRSGDQISVEVSLRDVQSICPNLPKIEIPQTAQPVQEQGVILVQAVLHKGRMDNIEIWSGPESVRPAIHKALQRTECSHHSVAQLLSFRLHLQGTTVSPVPLFTGCQMVTPHVPRAAIVSGIEGVVRVRIVIIDGVPQQVDILSGPEIYYSSVRNAILQYRCPALVGQFEALQEFDFHID